MALNENLPQATSPNAMSGPTRPSQEIEKVDKLYDSVLMKVTKMEASLKKSAEYMKEIVRSGGNSGSNINVGGQNPNIFGRVNDVTQSTLDKLNNIIPPARGPSGLDRAKSIGASAAYYAAAMMPNTIDAVTQRITTQGVASMIGMDPNALIRQSNALLRGGMTGSYSAQASTAILAGQGIIPTMGSYGNIMNQVGGLSVLTGMSNEQVAGGMGGINGMNFLRLGIQARTANGSIKDPATLANDLYRRMFGGRNITAEQAAQVFNVHSRSYQNIAMAAGGDQNLIASLQNMVYYQAKNGGQKLDLNPQNVKDNILKLPKDDPMRALYHYQGSEANKLEATGTGLVGGYSGALNTTATVNDQFAKLARILPALTTAFGNLKGFLDTLPMAGNTGPVLYGGIAKTVENWGESKLSKSLSKALDSVFGTNFSKYDNMSGSPANALVPYSGNAMGGGGGYGAAHTPMQVVNRQIQGFADQATHAMWGKLRGKDGRTSLLADIKGAGGAKSWAKNLFTAAKDAVRGYAKGGWKSAALAAAKDLGPRLGQAALQAGDEAFGYGPETGGWGNQTSLAPVSYPGIAGPYTPGAYSQGSAVQYPKDYPVPGAVYGDPNDPTKITSMGWVVRDPETGEFVSNKANRDAWLASQQNSPGTDIVRYQGPGGQVEKSGDGGNTIFAPGTMKGLFTKGKTFMKSPMGKMAGKLAMSVGIVMGTNWAVPKLRSWGARHGIKDHSWQDNLGTTAAYMGGYAAAGAMIAGPAGAVAGTAIGLARGLWYSFHKPKKEEKPKNVKHSMYGGILDPETNLELLHRNMVTGEYIPSRFGTPAYGNNYPDQERWQQGGYPTSSWLNQGLGDGSNKSTSHDDAHTSDTGHATARVSTGATKSDLPRSAAEAASWAIEQTKNNSSGWNNYCEKFAETAWGKAGRYRSAIAHWQTAVKEKRAYQGKNAPPGAMVFWGGGQYGHVAVSIGGGKVVSTDIKRPGKADIVSIDYVTKKWGKTYLGWADPSKKTKLDKHASAVDPSSVSVDTSVTSPQTASSNARNSGQPWWRDVANSFSSFFSHSSSSNSSSNLAGSNPDSNVFNVSDTGFTINSNSTSSLLGMGSAATASSMSPMNSGVTINMNVNIAHASVADAQRLARQVKDILERDLRNNSIRSY